MKTNVLLFFMSLFMFASVNSFAAFPVKRVAQTEATNTTTTTISSASPSAPATPSSDLLVESPPYYSPGTNQIAALLLSIFLGGIGIDRFYLGYTWLGILKLLTGGLFGILWIIDIIRIALGDLGPNGTGYSKRL
ncbi:TM2 domain-containing protein [Wenyingzhuangia sp. IMCC45533]